MKIYSFAYHHQKLVPIEIHVSLVRGLPTVQFTGSVDSSIKDSIPRIKSAIRSSGFKWPKAQQILIHIHPNHFKIVSYGLDLALAVAILVESGQIEKLDNEYYFYSELGLNGHTIKAEGLSLIEPIENLITAPLLDGLSFPTFSLDHMQDLKNFHLQQNPIFHITSMRPSLPTRKFSADAALALTVAAIGRHSALFVGPSGSGKSTLAESLYYLQSDPEEKMEGWRPFVHPHHSIPVRSFIGGGVPVIEGELSRAHNGLLLLDEYLEFHPHIQESLRGPLEQGRLEITRRGQKEIFPCQLQFIATSNLCPCGDLTTAGGIVCGRALFRCRAVFDRLSGPVLDRFDSLYFSDSWRGERVETLEQILEKVETVRRWRKKQGLKEAVFYTQEELESFVEPFAKEFLVPTESLGSERRRRALLRLARSFADLEQSEKVLGPHLEAARGPTLGHFYALRQLFA